MKRVRKVLEQPMTIGHFLVFLATVAVTVLMLGANGEDPKMVYRAQTLYPQPVQSVPVSPVVKQEVVNAPSPTPEIKAPENPSSGGYVAGGSNCVAFVCAMAPGLCQQGNAGTWSANSSTPSVGAVMIFRPGQQGASGYGHVGVVTGVNGNTVSLAHANWRSGQTTFQSTGNFYR